MQKTALPIAVLSFLFPFLLSGSFTDSLNAQESAVKQSFARSAGDLKKNGTKPGERKVINVNGVEFAFRWCPAGKYVMGAPDTTRYKVTFTKGFWMMETEVTCSQWTSVMGGARGQSNLPVGDVSWNDCQEFCKKCAQLGMRVQLPTEAQWEYACRAGSTGAYAGNLDEMAWHLYNSERNIHPVGSKNPNAWGLFDMHGNVCEWCQDGDSKDSKIRAYRGGNSFSPAPECRSAFQNTAVLSQHSFLLGFRCASFSADQKILIEELPAAAAEEKQPESIRELSNSGTYAGERKVITINGVEFAFKWCPAGTFKMGAPVTEKGWYEETQHNVTLTKGFWMLETEVTQKQWEAVMGDNPSESYGENLPVQCVSWDDCQKFCRKTGLKLPTEAQWEYACRAGTTGEYAGNLDEMAWYYKSKGIGYRGDESIHPVGTKAPNAWGLYDMHGNVSEWCQDRYGEYPSWSIADPVGPSRGESRVIRGGDNANASGSGNDAYRCRSASRCSIRPDFQNEYCGFRCVSSTAGQKSGSGNSSATAANNAGGQPESTNELPAEGTKAGERKVITFNGVAFAFRWCPAGTFMMGTPDITPHQVKLTKGFWIMETEVTQKQWKAVMGNNPSNFKGDNLPVEKVSWKDCHEFCKKCDLLGFPVQLPTEAQWEYACRAGTTGAYAGKLNEMAWYNSNSKDKTHPTGTKKPNAWGLYDMHGNVCEWCQDWKGKYSSSSETDPTGPWDGSKRIMRGGSWGSDAQDCRSAYRGSSNPVNKADFLGFRCVSCQ